jgi:sugar phosphate isomerase/epimerase
MNPIILAPTTLGETPPLEYIEIAARAGYDGIGLRLYPSPGMTFFPIVGDAALEQSVRRALSNTGLKVFEIFTCYLQPGMDFEAMKRAHEYGASLGAKYALVIGDDPEWDRLVQSFGRLCDNAAQFGLTCALEAPVGRRTLKTLELNLKVIEEAKRPNVGLSVDPAQYMRSGGTAAMLKAVDPKLFHYGQINDTASMQVGDPLCMPGEGAVPLYDYLDALPPDLMLGLEYHHRDDRYTPLAWATHVLEGTRAFLRRYEASRHA